MADEPRIDRPGIGQTDLDRTREADDPRSFQPSDLDVHGLAQTDNPEEDWGEPAGGGALHSANHTRRPIKTEAERGQGPKTRQRTKDLISRRT